MTENQIKLFKVRIILAIIGGFSKGSGEAHEVLTKNHKTELSEIYNVNGVINGYKYIRELANEAQNILKELTEDET